MFFETAYIIAIGYCTSTNLEYQVSRHVSNHNSIIDVEDENRYISLYIFFKNFIGVNNYENKIPTNHIIGIN